MLITGDHLPTYMREREISYETIDRGKLFFLNHPANDHIFSGYGLTVEQGRKDLHVGLLMVDRPRPADPVWLNKVEEAFGEYRLVPMTASGERGILCQMHIEPDSLVHLRSYNMVKAAAIKTSLEPLLDELPKPVLALRWDEGQRLWQSHIAYPNELPQEICEVFENSGYGCLSAESTIGVVHVCHASDVDIDGFAEKPISSQWQLIKMPTAPLIRLELLIYDQPENPYKFESFLNVSQEDQARILAKMASQEMFYLTFYDENLDYHFTKIIPHDKQQWQYLDELVMEAVKYWSQIPPEERDFDAAKAEFLRRTA